MKGEKIAMKTLFTKTAFLFLAFALLLTSACVAPSADSSASVDPSPTSSVAPRPTPETLTNTEIATPSAEPAPTVADVVADYLSGNHQLTSYYDVREADSYLSRLTGETWLGLDLDVAERYGEFDVCPAAIFPDEIWTPESVLASYLDQSAHWVSCDYGDSEQILWSQDYHNVFHISDEWLKINGSKTLPVDHQTTSDLTPQAVTKLYQSGQWTAEKYLWSEDHSTCVRIGDSGRLEYSYDNPLNSRYNLNQYTYADCAEQPWWGDRDSLKQYQGFAFQYLGYDDRLSFDSIAYTNCYPDLPDGQCPESITDVIDIVWTSHGLWITTPTEVYFYSHGQLADSWQLSLDPDNSFIYPKNDTWQTFKSNYLYTGDRLVELLPQGEIHDIISDVIIAHPGKGSFDAIYLEGSSLIKWQHRYGEVTTEIVANNVTEAVAVSYRDIFCTWTDGFSYNVYVDQEKSLTRRLGGAPLDDYVKQWQAFVENYQPTPNNWATMDKFFDEVIEKDIAIHSGKPVA